MNTKTRIQRNKISQVISINHRYKNCVKFSKEPGESDAHRDVKYMICKWLTDHDIEYYTESYFINDRGRADIIVSDWGMVIEIMDTEDIKSIKDKSLKYPLPILPVATWWQDELIINVLEDMNTSKNSKYYFDKLGGDLYDKRKRKIE